MPFKLKTILHLARALKLFSTELGTQELERPPFKDPPAVGTDEGFVAFWQRACND